MLECLDRIKKQQQDYIKLFIDTDEWKNETCRLPESNYDRFARFKQDDSPFARQATIMKEITLKKQD